MQNIGVNMAFVLFRCELDIYKVQLYVNERLTPIPGSATDTSLFSEFADIVQPIIQTWRCERHLREPKSRLGY